MFKWTDVSEGHTASIIRVMKAVHTSETSVHFNMTTWRYIPEDSASYLSRENLKSHKDDIFQPRTSQI
jgi:hypothetical protein